MKRSIKYLVVLCIMAVCIYGFRAWLQYKGKMVIKHTTNAIVAQLAMTGKLETVSKPFTKTIEGGTGLTTILPGIGADQIINSALFKNTTSLDVQGIVTAGYDLQDISTEDVAVTSDGTVTIDLGEPKIFGVALTGELQTTKLGIVTKSEIDMENELRAKAGDMMIQDALSGGILKEAKANAENQLQDLFLKANIQIKEVILHGTGAIY